MTNRQESTLRQLLLACCSAEECAATWRAVHVAPAVLDQAGHGVSRAVLAQALSLLLFRELLRQTPTGSRYVEDCVSSGRRVVFDHGAVRTVDLSGMGDLPGGVQAITRVLIPLGYRLGEVYPLDKLRMTGRSYTHSDFPEELPQFFVSELHPHRFSPEFQSAVARVTATSRDPLTAEARKDLHELDVRGVLAFDRAKALLPVLLSCFQRQHAIPSLSDYEALLEESAEMAWIATEGNVFNHATDRVTCLDDLVAEQRRLGRPLKEIVEKSRSGRVRQTAFRADPVERDFVGHDGGIARRAVPGSFYEFIQRDQLRDPATGTLRLDLAFDSGNAQGIFKMTAAA